MFPGFPARISDMRNRFSAPSAIHNSQLVLFSLVIGRKSGARVLKPIVKHNVAKPKELPFDTQMKTTLLA